MTGGVVRFDHHGYGLRRSLIAHHEKGGTQRAGWNCRIVAVDVPMLETPALNARRMPGRTGICTIPFRVRAGSLKAWRMPMPRGALTGAV